MGKSVEELLIDHNKAAREWNRLHKTEPEKAAKYQAEYKKLWKQILTLRAKNAGKDVDGGDE